MSVNLKGVKNGQIVGVVNGIKYPSKIKYVRNYLAIEDKAEQTVKGKELKKQDMLILGGRVMRSRNTRQTRRKDSNKSKRPYRNIDIEELQTLFGISDSDLGIHERSRSNSRSGKGKERSRSRERVSSNSTQRRERS